MPETISMRRSGEVVAMCGPCGPCGQHDHHKEPTSPAAAHGSSSAASTPKALHTTESTVKRAAPDSGTRAGKRRAIVRTVEYYDTDDDEQAVEYKHAVPTPISADDNDDEYLGLECESTDSDESDLETSPAPAQKLLAAPSENINTDVKLKRAEARAAKVNEPAVRHVESDELECSCMFSAFQRIDMGGGWTCAHRMRNCG